MEMRASSVETDVEGIKRKIATAKRTIAQLLQRINSQSAEQLGIKVSGFLRQDFAAKRNVTHLFHPHRIHQKSCVGLSPAHLLNGIIRVPHIADMQLVAHSLR